MGQRVIAQLNSFKTFKYDENVNRIINMKFQQDTDVDEFLDIQYILDKNKVNYRFDKNFDIQVLS